MAIVQTAAQFEAAALKVGFPKERAAQVYADPGVATAANVAALRTIVNKYGYHDQRANHLVDAGVTFA